MANEIETANTPETTTEEGTEAPERRGFGLQSRDVLPVVAALAGLAAGFSGQDPTGNAAADFVLSFGFGWALVWFTQFARSEAIGLTAVLALLFSGLTMPAGALAMAALAIALFVISWSSFDPDSATIALALSAALSSQAVLRLPDIGFTGSASLLAAIAVAPIVVTGFSKLGASQRRMLTRGALVCAVFAVVATVLGVVAALGTRDRVETAITQAEAGVTALQAADRPAALALLAESEENFATAHDRLSGPLTWPARFVPIAAQHSRALETAAAQGEALARTAGRTVNQADVEKIRGVNGALDLGIVEAVNGELNLANATMLSAQQSLLDVSVPWLLPQLSSRLDSVQDELATTAEDIDLANHATAVLPRILGSDGLRRYLVLFVQPSESREYGGLVGAYGILEADQGRMNLLESGSINVGLGLGLAQFTEPGAFPETYAKTGPQINPQNLTATADLGTIAAAARDFVPQWRIDSDFTIDGVITIDPYALAGLLELTGPLQVDGIDEPIDTANVTGFLLRDQYLTFEAEDRDERQDALRFLAGQAFDRLFEIEIPGPERLGSIFGPLARANRLSFTTFNDFENAFLERVFLSANMPQVGSAVDMVGVFGQTGTASKLDGYASRTSSYEVVIDPATGQVNAELTVTERNDAPPDAGEYVLGNTDELGPTGEPLAHGNNLVALAVYTRGDVQSLSVDTVHRVDPSTPAYSYDRHQVVYEVPLAGEATVSLSHNWQVEPERYDVFIPAQPTANVGDFTLTIRPTAGWRVVGPDAAADGSFSETFTSDEARGMTFLFERTNE